MVSRAFQLSREFTSNSLGVELEPVFWVEQSCCEYAPATLRARDSTAMSLKSTPAEIERLEAILTDLATSRTTRSRRVWGVEGRGPR